MTRFGNAEPIPRTTDLIISYFLSLHATGATNMRALSRILALHIIGKSYFTASVPKK